MNKFKRFIYTGRNEKLLIIRATFLLVAFRLGLWVAPFRWTRKWVNRETSNSPPTKVKDGAAIRDTIRAVRSCSRYVPHATCLTQALAAQSLLRRIGQSADIKIGVAVSGENFEAHAWLEVDGQIVLGKQARHSRYVILGPYNSATV